MILPDQPPSQPAFAVEVLGRLPLADAFYALWAYTANDDLLAHLFDAHRGRCYQDVLTFDQLVRVLVDALTRYHGKGRGAILDAIDRSQLGCQARAVYGKLARLPLPLAEAFLAALTQRPRPLLPPGYRHTALPDSVAGLTVVVIDGKKIKNAAKRLRGTRGVAGKLYGGKVLVAYLPKDGLAVALAADPDGEANDARLVPAVLPLGRAAVAGPRLWVADRQFGDLTQPPRLCQDGDHYLIRYSRHVTFTADPARPATTGTDRQGRSVTQAWGWLGADAQGDRRVYARRITLPRPGQETVVVATDLLDADAYPAGDLLEIYLTRWQIETVFQQITEVFDLRQLIGGTPQATVFQAALCLVIYNVLQVVRAHIAAGQAKAAVSAEVVFEDMKKDLIGLHAVLSVAELLQALAAVPSTAEAMRDRLRTLVGGLWSTRWAKAVNNTPRPHRAKAKGSGAHTSVHKLLQQAKTPTKKKKRPRPGRQ